MKNENGTPAVVRCAICGEETTHNRESSMYGHVHRHGPTDHDFTPAVAVDLAALTAKAAALDALVEAAEHVLAGCAEEPYRFEYAPSYEAQAVGLVGRLRNALSAAKAAQVSK